MNDYGNTERYADDNAKVQPPKPGERRVVFMGDSITDNWQRPQFGGFFPGKSSGPGGIEESPAVAGDQPLQPRDLLRLPGQLCLQLRVLRPQPLIGLLQHGNHIRRIRRTGHTGTTSEPALRKQHDTLSQPARSSDPHPRTSRGKEIRDS